MALRARELYPSGSARREALDRTLSRFERFAHITGSPKLVRDGSDPAFLRRGTQDELAATEQLVDGGEFGDLVQFERQFTTSQGNVVDFDNVLEAADGRKTFVQVKGRMTSPSTFGPETNPVSRRVFDELKGPEGAKGSLASMATEAASENGQAVLMLSSEFAEFQACPRGPHKVIRDLADQAGVLIRYFDPETAFTR